MAVEHKLKCWPNYFEAIERGEKTFEVRRDDRGYQKGDVLILQKYDPEKARYVYYGDHHMAELRRKVKYIMTGGQFGLEPGYVVMALGK